MRKYMYLIKRFFLKLMGKDLVELDIRYYKSLGVIIGENMKCYSKLITQEPYLLEFGNDVTVAGGVVFINHDNSIIKLFDDATITVGRIRIGNNCFIGQNTIILPGIEIADNTIIAAGSVVTKSFKQGDIIIGGNPARIIGSIYDYKNKVKDNRLNTDGMNFDEKKHYLLSNEHKFLQR